MKILGRAVLSFLAASVVPISLQAQFTAEELAARPYWEEFLSKAKIIKAEKIGEGVTKPKKMLLRKEGGAEGVAVWKSPGGIGAGTTDRWECEVVAYRLDKLMGLNMVPPTVARRHKLNKGSLQLWVDLALSELDRTERNIPVPPEKAEAYERARSLQRAWDSLIANSDRTLQNLRFTQDWRLILIDHSRAFRGDPPFTEQLIYGKNGFRPNQGFTRLPRAFVDKLKSLTESQVRQAAEDYLTGSEIRAILVRRDMILAEVAELIKERGEDAVLY